MAIQASDKLQCRRNAKPQCGLYHFLAKHFSPMLSTPIVSTFTSTGHV